jgi:hypothetical protein
MSRSPSGTAPAEPPARYEIRVKGVLESHWSACFDGLQISSDELGQTTIAGPVTDQAAAAGPTDRFDRSVHPSGPLLSY